MPARIGFQQLLAILTLTAIPVVGGAQQAPARWASAAGFMVQDVCIDASGKILNGVTPVDDETKCPRRRDINVGERLPYHKHDWSPLASRSQLPDGFQSQDSFPIVSRTLGFSVVDEILYQAPDRTPGTFGKGDGGQVIFFSDRTAGVGITEDGNGGLQFFYRSGCGATFDPRTLLDSWILIDGKFSPEHPDGQAESLVTEKFEDCQRSIGTHGFAVWNVRTVPFHVRSFGRESSRNFVALESSHYAGPSLAAAGALERMYFTRELGLTRWEAWRNLDRREQPNDRPRAERLAKAQTCDPIADQPLGTGTWVMVDCRQWTNLGPTRAAAGDEPGVWIRELQRRPQTASIFAP